MDNLILITQTILSIVLVLLILVQSKGTGLSKAWGSGGISSTRRGLERLMFKATFVVAGFFIIISILQVVL
jgi:preprotein translocase subunit SecG